MENKKIFEEPVIELNEFSIEDVINTSGGIWDDETDRD